MISKVLIFNTQHEAAEALKKLEASGFTPDRLRVIVSDLDHSRLLNAETAIHIDMLTEITNAEKGAHNSDDHISYMIPFFTPQTSMQIPINSMPGMASGDWDDMHALEVLKEYGLIGENATICRNALRDGKSIVCILDNHMESSLFDNLYMGFSDDENNWLPETGAASILTNR